MRMSAFLLLVPLLLTACGGGSGEAPPQAFDHPLLVEANHYGGPAPADAEVVTPEMFVELVESGAYRLVTASDREAELAGANEEARINRTAATSLYANESELLQRMVRDVQPGDPDATPMPGGNFMFRGIPADPQVGTSAQWFQLGGTRFSDRELVTAKEQYEKQETQLAIYAQFHAQLPAGFKQQLMLPDPDDVAGEDFEFLHELNQTVGSQWGQLKPIPTPQPPPSNYPASWRDEIGASGQGATARGLDRRGPEGLPTGLWAQVDFPLKYCATRVRSQGARDTGVHFAITAAIEARTAAIFGRHVNLSEQFCVNQNILSRPPVVFLLGPISILGGGTPEAVLEFLHRSGFVYPYEHRWDYNPSWYRRYHGTDPLFSAPSYTRSCWASATGARYVGRFCSDTAHQSPMACTTSSFSEVPLCATRDPVEVEQDSGVSLHSSSVVAHYERRALNHDIVKTLLIGKVPIVYYFAVPRRGLASPGGILPYDAADNEIGGSHAAVILGYVENADLRPGFPPGSGGGYYILKNSWGTGFGDHGYFYAPDDWVAKYLISMHAILGTTG